MKPQETTLDYFNQIKVFGKPFPHPNASYAYYIKFRFTLDAGRRFMRVLRHHYPVEYGKTKFYLTKTTDAVFIGGEYDKRHMTSDMWSKVIKYKETIV